MPHVERLERLASLLERDAANDTGARFDLGTWATPSEGNNAGAWNANDKIPPMSCGTSACAMGLAAISGEFAKEGLTAEFTPRYISHDARERREPDGYYLYPTWRETPGSEPEEGFDAGAALFAIHSSASHYLFDPDWYSSTMQGADAEREVARRIRNFAHGIIEEGYRQTAGGVVYTAGDDPEDDDSYDDSDDD